ncbi:C2H2 and C2HC zinc fingers superfamily protein isoform X2 [Wolffia australiana]
MRKESAAKEKEKKEAFKALEQIESRAQRSYQKDLKSFEKSKILVEQLPPAFDNDPKVWQIDASSGYYHNSTSGYFYDPKSLLYYSDKIGDWVNREELYISGQGSKPLKPSPNLPTGVGGPAPGLVISKTQASLLSKQPVKGASSSLATVSLAKRKREDDKKPKAVSKEEVAALKAREEARKRVEEREKHLLGLYKSY